MRVSAISVDSHNRPTQIYNNIHIYNNIYMACRNIISASFVTDTNTASMLCLLYIVRDIVTLIVTVQIHKKKTDLVDVNEQ
jgi:hypothetical protein